MANRALVNSSDNAESPSLETGIEDHQPPTLNANPAESPVPSRSTSLGPESISAENVDHDGPITAGRKRKLNSTSSRGVANLTPDQLAKKRANDRQAQRAIRERTRTHIEALEKQVRDLSSQKPFLDLQATIKHNERLRAENQELRQGLRAVMDIIRPLLIEKEHPEMPTSLTIPEPAPSRSYTSPCPDADLLTATGRTSDDKRYSESIASVDAPSPTQSAPTPSSRRNSSHGGFQPSSFREALSQNIAHGLDFGVEERLGFNFLLDPSQIAPKVDRLRRSSSDHARAFHSNPLSPLYLQSVDQPSDRISAEFATPIKNTPPTCTLDGIMMDFLQARQREAAQGIPRQKLVGPPYPSVSSLLNPEKSVHSHPVSKVFTDILRAFPDISSLPEQVAVLYTMFLLMRWQIYPTQENYERLPEWLKPRPSQLHQPHPAWMDYVPWPRMRDRLVAAHQGYPFDNWFIPFTRGMCVNWPYEATDCLLSTGDSEELLINPVFERHMRNLSNWSLGSMFAESYPHLVDTTRIKAETRKGNQNPL